MPFKFGARPFEQKRPKKRVKEVTQESKKKPENSSLILAFIVFSDACQDNYIALKLDLTGEDGARYGGFGNKSLVVAGLLSSSALAPIRTNANAQVCSPPAFIFVIHSLEVPWLG